MTKKQKKKPENAGRPPHDPSEPEHDDLYFVSVTAEYVYHDRLKIKWAAFPQKDEKYDENHDDTAYQVILVQNPRKIRAVTYSMLTLGLQSAFHDVWVMAAGNENLTKDVSFHDQSKEPPKYKPANGDWLQIPPTGITEGKNGLPCPIKEKIWFIEFSSEVLELKVRTANRIKVGETKWYEGPAKVENNHENIPPGTTTEK